MWKYYWSQRSLVFHRNQLFKNKYTLWFCNSFYDFTMIDAFKNGADGIISVAANAYPTEFNDIIKEINSNNFNVDDSTSFWTNLSN